MRRLFGLLFLMASVASAQVNIGGSQIQIGSGNPVSVFSPDKVPGTMAYFASNKKATLAAGASLDILPAYSGQGYVNEIFIGGCGYYSTLQITVTVDGEATPSINAMPVTTLLGTPPSYYNIANYAGEWVTQSNYYSNSTTGDCGNGVFRLPIPFSSSVHISLKNNGAGSMSIWYIVKYNTGVTDNFPYTQHLYAASFSASGIAAYATTNLINVTTPKKGRLAGISWVYDGYPGSLTPYKAALEGPFCIFIDGSGTATYCSSGSEDFFGEGDYFKNFDSFGEASAPPATNTMTPASNSIIYMLENANTWGAQRFFIKDPVAFNTGLKITWSCGFNQAGVPAITSGTCYTGGVVWYYTEN